ncbi:LOW QUALITY PROTEIN: hypothetical protein HID58_042720, partial [Brassica napus]
EPEREHKGDDRHVVHFEILALKLRSNQRAPATAVAAICFDGSKPRGKRESAERRCRRRVTSEQVVTYTLVKHQHPRAINRIDVDIATINQEAAIRAPTTDEEDELCTICFAKIRGCCQLTAMQPCIPSPMHCRLDTLELKLPNVWINLIITDFEGTNRPPTVEEESVICTVCFENYNYGNNLCYLSCAHNFYFPCIDQSLRRNISCPICKDNHL